MRQRQGVRAGARCGGLDPVGGGGLTDSSGLGWRVTAWVAVGALALSSALVAPGTAGALAPPVEQKLTASDAAPGDDFGYSVAASGSNIVVGASGAGQASGAVYLFGWDGSGGSPQQEKLTADDSALGDLFGDAVAAGGDTIVVGAWGDDDGGSSSGSAYVFRPDGSGGYAQVKLTASDAAAGDYFGVSVAVAGDTVVVGAPRDDDGGSSSGSAYVFRPDGSGGYAQVKLTASDAAAGDYFGVSVAVAGDTVVVGAPRDDDGGSSSGSAYVFRPDGSGGYAQVKLTASDAAASDYFGYSVGLAGDVIVVGARFDDYNGYGSGSVYVFDPDGSGGYVEQAKLIGDDAAEDAGFGVSVAATGERIVVGASGDGDGSGSAYVFGPDGSGGWARQAKLTASDSVIGDYFGNSVGVIGNTIVVGAQYDEDDGYGSGSAYVFGPDGSGGWAQQRKLTASDAAAGDRFGNSVGVAGDTIVVGAYGDDDAGDNSGSAYAYRPATPVTPVGPPAPTGPTCEADGVFNPPAAQAGVVWSVDPAGQTGPGSYVVTAAPAPGYYIPAGAQATWRIAVAARLTEGCVVPGPPVPTVSVRAVSGGMRLFVDVNPNKGRGYWQFTVQKLVKGKWRARSKVYKTWGSDETRRLRLSRGTYRVMVLPRYGYAGAISEVVSLRSAPAAVAHPDRGVAASVKVRAVSRKSKLHVNINPNMGRGYWQFAVQKHSKGQWRALSKVYKTYRRSETRRLNLRRGTYRVIVMPRYGYDEVMSDTVWLRR